MRRRLGVMDNSNNSVKCIKTLIHTADARVAEFEMEPETEGEVHYHSIASERCICLNGQIQIKMGSGTTHSLKPGGKLEIPAGESHQVINAGTNPCQYLVIQYGGAYDFITV